MNELLEKLKQCDDFHNRCDFLMEHDEITYMLDYITNLQQENKKYKEVINKAINNSQYWIDYYTRLNSDERIVLRLQENIDILKEVK